MVKSRRISAKKVFDITLFVIVWTFTIWLLYPILTTNSLESWDSKTYFYRTILGIAIMLVLFGKTIFDLFFPLDSSKKESLFQTIFLTLYGLIVVTGILYVAGRLVLFYFKSSNAEFFSM
ncbi:hypothetical protein ACFLRW_01225 [Acidobacteriota bacterium]